MGGEADLVEVLHRLLARARLLLRYQQHLCLAVEEALGWLHVPPSAVPLNAATMDAQIWQTVSSVVSSTEGGVSGELQASARNASAPVVLLQEGWPSSTAALQAAVPGMPLRVIAGLRRRAWQINAANVVGANSSSVENVTGPQGNPTMQSAEPGMDCDLYLVQTEPSSSLPPPDRCGPLPRLSGRGLQYQRRRHRAPRPLPVVRDPAWMLRQGRERVSATPESAASTSGSAVHRARSRSRDDSHHRSE